LETSPEQGLPTGVEIGRVTREQYPNAMGEALGQPQPMTATEKLLITR
jgi:hypothetical protein